MREHGLKSLLIVGGFLVGVLACAGVVGIYAYANAPVRPSSGLRSYRIVATCANLVLPQRVLLSPIADENMGEALKSMNLRGDEESKLRDKIARDKSRLLWADDLGLGHNQRSRGYYFRSRAMSIAAS
jgi:hypothetical protein